MTEWITHPASITILVVAILTAVGKLIYWIGGMNDFRGAVETALNEIKESVSTIQEDIKSILRSMPITPVSTESPLKLTDLGKEISSEVGAKEWALSVADGLEEAVHGMNAYGIQKHCFEYAQNHFRDDDIRNTAAEDSAYIHGLEVDKVLQVVGVELRDILLERNGLEPPD